MHINTQRLLFGSPNLGGSDGHPNEHIPVPVLLSAYVLVRHLVLQVGLLVAILSAYRSGGQLKTQEKVSLSDTKLGTSVELHAKYMDSYC